VFRRLEEFDYRGEGALEAYLRQALMNRIRNEIRRASARPVADPIDSSVEDRARSPVDLAMEVEARDRYDAALSTLSPDDREAVIARVELGMTYQEICRALDRPSPDAVRMAIGRALVRLSKEMGRDGR
jgi:RNA polymerase sigma-70 factor (ECF subfamily)